MWEWLVDSTLSQKGMMQRNGRPCTITTCFYLYLQYRVTGQWQNIPSNAKILKVSATWNINLSISHLFLVNWETNTVCLSVLFKSMKSEKHLSNSLIPALFQIKLNLNLIRIAYNVMFPTCSSHVILYLCNIICSREALTLFLWQLY